MKKFMYAFLFVMVVILALAVKVSADDWCSQHNNEGCSLFAQQNHCDNTAWKKSDYNGEGWVDAGSCKNDPPVIQIIVPTAVLPTASPTANLPTPTPTLAPPSNTYKVYLPMIINSGIERTHHGR